MNYRESAYRRCKLQSWLRYLEPFRLDSWVCQTNGQTFSLQMSGLTVNIGYVWRPTTSTNRKLNPGHRPTSVRSVKVQHVTYPISVPVVTKVPYCAPSIYIVWFRLWLTMKLNAKIYMASPLCICRAGPLAYHIRANRQHDPMHTAFSACKPYGAYTYAEKRQTTTTLAFWTLTWSHAVHVLFRRY